MNLPSLNTIPFALQTPPATRANRANRGRALESLILASQTSVALTKIPSCCKRIGGNKLIPIKGPVDYFGIVHATGKMIVFDAKTSRHKLRLETREAHLPNHQRYELLRYGGMGAISGLLVESTNARELYWCEWMLLLKARPSIPYSEMIPLGSSAFAVKWENIFGECVEPVKEGGEK